MIPTVLWIGILLIIVTMTLSIYTYIKTNESSSIILHEYNELPTNPTVGQVVFYKRIINTYPQQIKYYLATCTSVNPVQWQGALLDNVPQGLT